MGTLYLVRHGQASFGAADYDELSALGVRQCLALGHWFRSHGLVFEGVLCGTLRRHLQTLAALHEGHGDLPEAMPWPGLNEYDSEAVIEAAHPGVLQAMALQAASVETYRSHFRLLRDALQSWARGVTSPIGMPSYVDFVAGVTAALDHVRTRFTGNVLIVSSGGPISTAVGHILGTSRDTAIDLNLRIRNSSVTEFSFTPKRHQLLSFNHLPHLDDIERRDWVTYS